MPASPNIPQSAVSRRRVTHPRLFALKLAFFLGFLLVLARLVQVQVINAPSYRETARRQYESRVPLQATRGPILDRNGRPITSSAMAISFGADPAVVGSRAPALAARCSRLFGRPVRFYLEKLRAPGRRFVWLERRLPAETAARLRREDFPGLVVVQEPRRLYHYDHLAGQLIGFTDLDNKGISGVELQYDDMLRGVNGYVIMQRDGHGGRHHSVDYPRIDPVNGNTVTLTLDLACQNIAEEELENGIERSRADAGLVVMLDPRTGEVLAMANYPGLDPHGASTADDYAKKNRIITDRFEPGSVFKLVTAAAALEHRLVAPEERFFAEHGRYLVPVRGSKPRLIQDTHEYGMLTFREAMEVSSNIVMAKISDRVGAEKLYTMARNFGFGIPTGVGLPGEVGGELKKPTSWSLPTLNSMAFGYEVGVTALQIAAAYAAVANGGVLLRPWILKRVVGPDGEVMLEGKPQVIRRVIEKSTARRLTEMLKGAVRNGTGVEAQIEGITVAGKTGTARTAVSGKYERLYRSSFAGFFPADDPRYICLVMLESPKGAGYTGGMASAPIFRGIAEKLAALSDRLPPSHETVVADGAPVAVPDVTNIEHRVAAEILEEHGLTVITAGGGSVVLGQSPRPGTKVQKGAAVRLSTAAAVPCTGRVNVPDVRGLTIRRAINRLAASGLDVTVEGSGVVTAQQPPPGRMVAAGTPVRLSCSPGLRMLAARAEATMGGR